MSTSDDWYKPAMAGCTFVLNRMPHSTLQTATGWFVAFSGHGPHQNNPDSCGVANEGPLPTGRYYIVDRESGGVLGPVRDLLRGKYKWFALYRDDGTIDDRTFIENVQRGRFRLHPGGPGGGRSDGCVTLPFHEQFDRLRAWLLGQPDAVVPGTAMRTYGTLDVASLAPAELEMKFRPKKVGAA